MLCLSLSEGYCCNIRTILHRVIEYEGKQYYSSNNMGINFPAQSAAFHMTYKWTPGFNDYPLGEDFDYSKVKIVQEWITGAFNTKDEYII